MTKFKSFVGLALFVSVVLCFFMMLPSRNNPPVKLALNNQPVELAVEINVETIAANTGRLFEGEKTRHFARDRLKTTKIDRTPLSTKPISQLNVKCRFWSVVTTIFEPTESIAIQAELGEDWCLLIVGDHKSLSEEDYLDKLGKQQSMNKLGKQQSKSPIIYLDVKHQRRLAATLRLVDELPWDSFARKNVGFLYAVIHGAEAIWDFDDGNALMASMWHNPLIHYIQSPVFEVFEPTNFEAQAFNPYMLFGPDVKFCWPRGLPLTEVKNPKSYLSLKAADALLSRKQIESRDIGVVQSMARMYPDVDAIYRLTRDLPVRFDFPLGADILVPQNAFVPFNAEATLFKPSSYWMLYLPVTVPRRVTDIWRSYFAEALSRNVAGQRLVFSRPLVDQRRNPHSYLTDFQAEQDLYLKSNALLKFLRAWQPQSKTLPDRMIELYIELYEREFLEERDVFLVHCWVQSLKLANYSFPSITKN